MGFEMKFNGKVQKFIDEYATDHNGTRAAIAAGYSKPRAGVTACELLQEPQVQKALVKVEERLRKEWSAKLNEVVEHLYYCVTRMGTDFIDKDGRIETDIRKIPKRAAAAIDGIEQKVETWTDSNGEQHERVTTRLKLVPKIGAIEQAMRHKGLFAPTQIETNQKLILDTDNLYPVANEPDEIEQRILEVEAKRLPDK